MSDVEKKSETQEAAPKKKPYNLREKKEKKAAYRSLIRAELADELYDKILNIVVVQKKYKDPNYSAKDLAKELKTNKEWVCRNLDHFHNVTIRRSSCYGHAFFCQFFAICIVNFITMSVTFLNFFLSEKFQG